MRLLRLSLFAVLGLSASVPMCTAEQPRPGKVRLVRELPKSGDTDRVLGFSQDGRRLLSAGGDSFVVWDVKTGREIVRFLREGKSAYDGSFLPDGKSVVASFLREKAILLLDVASGEVLSRFPQPHSVGVLAITSDGKTLASYSSDGFLHLWDVTTRKEVRQLRPRPPEGWCFCTSLVSSPSGKLVAMAVTDGSVYLCDVAPGGEARRLFHKFVSAGGSEIAFSPDGRFLAVSAQEFVRKDHGFEVLRGLIRIWDVRSGAIAREFRRPDPPRPPPPAGGEWTRKWGREWADYRNEMHWGSLCLNFSPDGKTLVNVYWRTQLWEVATGQVRHEFDDATRTAYFSPDGTLLATGAERPKPDAPGPIRLWRWRDPCLEQPKLLGSRDIDRLWDRLASENAAVAYQAMATLLAHPETSVAALAKRFKRVEPVAPAEIERLVRDLDDDTFSVRERAAARLANLGEPARLALLRMKDKRLSPEARRRIEELLTRPFLPITTDQLRCLRAVEVLEAIGTEDARQAIRKLASETSEAVETEDARAALKRLERRQVKQKE